MDNLSWSHACSLLSSARLANDLLLTFLETKPCCRLTISICDLAELGSFLGEFDLFFTEPRLSRLSISCREHGAYSASSSIGASSGAEYATIFVSRSKELSRRAFNASDLQNDYALGILLGYPDCCASRFVALRALAQQNSMSLLPYLDGDATCFDKLLNVWGWFLDAGVTSHFPCNLACGRSAALARKSLNILSNIAPKHTDDLVGHLAATVGKTDYGFSYKGSITGKNYALSECGEEMPAQTISLNRMIDGARKDLDDDPSGKRLRIFEFC